MRLSTLVLASAFVSVVVSGSAVADSNESAVAAPAVAEIVAGVAPEATPPMTPEVGVAPQDEIAPSDPAPEATEVVAEALAPPAAPLPVATDLTWEDFEDPTFDPMASALPKPESQVVPHSNRASAWIPLGPMGVDEHGVEGRIHTVSTGETLWDISEAYLGTPWVWPSVWDENQGIDNPHLIEPGDKIWITSNEMRRVTDEEADEMIAALPDDDFYDDTFLAEEPLPASLEDELELPVAIPLEAQSTMTGAIITLPREHDASFTDVDTMDNASRIIDAPTLRAFLTQGDEVYLDLGEGEVSLGAQFAIFREIDKIRDLETGAVLGYHFDELGWLKVTKIEGESSTAVIEGARSEIERGDHMVPRVEPARQVAVLQALEDIDGAIVFTPGNRWMMGMTDSVFLNVGSIHGVEVGTQMEVYIPGLVQDAAQMPDTVIAQMVVISVEPETSVAFVTETKRELGIGDQVRAVGPDQLAVR